MNETKEAMYLVQVPITTFANVEVHAPAGLTAQQAIDYFKANYNSNYNVEVVALDSSDIRYEIQHFETGPVQYFDGTDSDGEYLWWN